MSLPAFATAVELAEWLGEPITDEHDVKRAERILRAVSNKIRIYTHNQWVNADGFLRLDNPEVLADVTLSCAARYYVNPNAETQWTSQIDDAMDGGGRRVESAGIYLTDGEKNDLDTVRESASGVIAGAVASVATTRGDLEGYAREDGVPWFVVNGL